MTDLFSCFSGFLTQVVSFEPFIYCFASMTVCAVVGLVMYIIKE